MSDRYDVIIVGAGPAGLFAALELIKKNKKILILDKGRAISSRACPMKAGARSAYTATLAMSSAGGGERGLSATVS